MSALTAIIQAPGALFSWALNRMAKFVYRVATRSITRVDAGATVEWVEWEQSRVSERAVLNYIALFGPRWNPHALLATTRGFRVVRRISLDLDRAIASARSFSVVVYDHRSTGTIAAFTPFSPRDEQGRAYVDLPPGEYRLGARYYTWTDEPRLPAVWRDGEPLIAERPCSPDGPAYMHGLVARESWFHRWTQRHMLYMLRHPGLFSAERIAAEYLPVGNPETTFRYGLREAGEALRVVVAPSLLERALAMLVCYDEASFPIEWQDLAAGETLLAPRDHAGHWLVRVQPLVEVIDPPTDDELSIARVPPGGA